MSPGVVRSRPESFGVAQSRLESPRVVWSRPKLSGVVRSHSESFGVVWIRLESSVVVRSRSESSEVIGSQNHPGSFGVIQSRPSRPESVGVKVARSRPALNQRLVHEPNRLELSGVLRSRPELSEVVRNRSKSSGVVWSRPDSSGVVRRIKGLYTKNLNEIKCLITSTYSRTAPVDSDRFRFQSTPSDSRRCLMTPTSIDSGRLRTTLDDSESGRN